jgi:hypothetical protein
LKWSVVLLKPSLFLYSEAESPASSTVQERATHPFVAVHEDAATTINEITAAGTRSRPFRQSDNKWFTAGD